MVKMIEVNEALVRDKMDKKKWTIITGLKKLQPVSTTRGQEDLSVAAWT